LNYENSVGENIEVIMNDEYYSMEMKIYPIKEYIIRTNEFWILFL